MIAGSALTKEPAISTGMLVVRPADSAARPTVIVRCCGFCRNSSPTSRSSQIWMNCSTVTVAMAGQDSGSAIRRNVRS